MTTSQQGYDMVGIDTLLTANQHVIAAAPPVDTTQLEKDINEAQEKRRQAVHLRDHIDSEVKKLDAHLAKLKADLKAAKTASEPSAPSPKGIRAKLKSAVTSSPTQTQ